jgi:hypothetical protein
MTLVRRIKYRIIDIGRVKSGSLGDECCRPARAQTTRKPLPHRTPSPSCTVRSPSYTIYTMFCTVDTSLLKIHNLSSKCTFVGNVGTPLFKLSYALAMFVPKHTKTRF